MIRRRSLHPGRRFLPLLAIALACAFTLGCPTSSGSDTGVASPSGSTGSTGGSAGTRVEVRAAAEAAPGAALAAAEARPRLETGIEAGETSGDGNTMAGGGAAHCQPRRLRHRRHPAAAEATPSAETGTSKPGRPATASTAGDGCSASFPTETPPPSSGGSASVTAVSRPRPHRGSASRCRTTVPEDGLLVVRIGAAGLSDAVTFAGEEMIHLSSPR